MSPYKRAFTSIMRNKLKTIILFFLTFVLGALMAIMLLTNHASMQAQQNVINNMHPQAIIGRDWAAITKITLRNPDDESFIPHRPIVPPLTHELINEIASLPYVDSYEYFLEREMFSLELDKYRLTPRYFPATELGFLYNVRGVQTPQFIEIEQNMIEIISGRTFTSDDMEQSLPVALISEEFARENQLAVGSVISLRSAVFNPNQVIDYRCFTEENALGSLFYDVEIIGIFHVAIDATSPYVEAGINYGIMEQLYNRIYVPGGFMVQIDEETRRLAEATGFYATLSELQELNWDEMTHDEAFLLHHGLYTVTDYYFMRVETFFILSHPHDMIPFIESVEPLLPEYYTVHFADNNFQAIIHAFESLERISTILLYITIGTIILIFSLLITLYMRTRKQEIGTYLAVGVRKRHIGSQMICEILMVSVPALILSLLVGNVIGNRISENMLINDLLMIEEMGRQEYSFNLFFMFGLGGEQATVNTLLHNYDNALTLGLSILFMVVAIMTILVSILLPLVYALRQNPKKIMM